MPSVKVRKNNVEAALRVFKKKCADHLWETRKKEYFIKPSEKRRAAKKAGIARARRRKNDKGNKF